LAALLITGSLAALGPWIWIQEEAKKSRTSDFAREITISVRIWANDNLEKYPDSKLGEKATANMAFRELFKSDILHDECIFGGERSRFIPDRVIGSAPDYAKALEPGENHWMLVAGLSTK
jgi:hypothetical protein